MSANPTISTTEHVVHLSDLQMFPTHTDAKMLQRKSKSL